MNFMIFSFLVHSQHLFLIEQSDRNKIRCISAKSNLSLQLFLFCFHLSYLTDFQHAFQSLLYNCERIIIINNSFLSPMRRNSETESSHVNIDTQMNLLNTWLRYKVPDYYQNIFLAYLDQQPPSLQQQQIRRQIKQTIDKSSFFYRIEKAQQDRKIQLVRIQQILSQKAGGVQNQLQILSKEANVLRNRNLELAELVVKMYERYKCNQSQAIQRQSPFYHSLFDSLDKENHSIKGSQLCKYIDFGEAYDPFIMNYYEQFHRMPSSQTKQSIKQLYNMNISQVYRFMKAKNTILDIKSELKQAQPIQQYNYAEKNQAFLDSYLKKDHHRNPRQQEEQNYMEDDNQPDEIYPKYQMREKKSSNKSMPIKISPIKILPSRQKSRTTIYPNHNERVHSPIQTQNYYDLKFTKMSNFDVYQHPQKTPYRKKTNKIYMETQPSEVNNDSGRNYYNSKGREKGDKDKSEKFKIEKLPPIKYSNEENRSSTYRREEFQIDKNHNAKKNKSYRVSQQQSLQKQVYRHKIQRPRLSLPQRELINNEDDTYKIINYNPIKRQQFNRVKFELKSSKYSYNPQNQRQNQQQIIKQQDEDQGGLIKQTPISKFNLKRSNPTKKQSLQIVPQSRKAREKISQEVQTTEQREPPPKRKQSEAKNSELAPKAQESKIIEDRNKNNNSQQISRKSNLNTNKQNVPKHQPQNSLKNVPVNNSKTIQKSKVDPTNNKLNDSNRTLQQEDIIDDRPSVKNPKNQSIRNNQPLIREANPPNSSTTPRKNDSTVSNIKNSQKKQIKMKIGKSSVNQIVNLIAQAPIPPVYKKIFNVEKLADWIKVNQTYLTQFHVDNSLGIIALCSPIPTIGMALKLWAPVNNSIDSATSSNLFLKYIQFIQKSTTVSKILFSGNGEEFKQLQSADFTKKKDTLFERNRKLPPKNIQFQFKPFLYIQCSNVVFTQNSPDTLLFSEEIQQFTPSNHYVAPYIEQINIDSIPKAISPLIKITQNISSFKQVNRILEEEEFDLYEAGDLKVSSINLLRLILNTPLKTNFVAGDGCIHLMASILYVQKDGLIASAPIAKHSGILYLAKGITFKQLKEKRTSPPISKSKIGVRMFSKNIYGRFPARPKGCYGNWQFSLTWEDEMPGRIRHPIPTQHNFGPSPFIFCVELSGEMIYGGSISSEDLIV